MDYISFYFSPGLSSVSVFFRVLFLLMIFAIIPAIAGCILAGRIFPVKDMK